MKKQLKTDKTLFITISYFWIILVLFYFLRDRPLSLNIQYFFEKTGDFSIRRFISLLLMYIINLVLSIGIISGAFFCGKLLLGKLGILEKTHYSDRIFFSTGIGFGIIAYLTLFLGLFGLLNQWVFFILWALLFYLGYKEISRFSRKEIYKKLSKISKSGFPYNIIIILFLLVALFNFLMSFTPEIFYDTLNYHLGAPNYYIQHGRIIPMPFKTHAHFPLTVSMIFLNGLTLGNYITAKLLNYSFALITVVGIFAFCRENFRINPVKTAILSSAVFYLTPPVIFRSWTASNDLGLILFAFLALSALIRFIKNNQTSWLVISAVSAGFMMGSKYTSIFFMLPLFILIFMKSGWKKAFFWGIAAFIIYSPWPLKNYIEAGNPVHPFMQSHFSLNYPHQLTQKDEYFSSFVSDTEGANKLLTLPWELSVNSGKPGPYASISYYMLGPVFLAVLPLLIFLKIGNRDILRLILFFVFVSYILWTPFSDQKIKYYVPAFPAMSLAVGFFAAKTELISQFFSKSVIIMIFAMLFANFLSLLPEAHLTHSPVSVLLGTYPVDEFLSSSRMLYPHPSYPAYRYISENLPNDSGILIFGDAKCFYIDRPFIAGDVAGLNPLIEYIRQSEDSSGLLTLFNEDEITHILVNLPETLRTASYGFLYFDKEDLDKLDIFWEFHIKLIFEEGHLYLYEIIDEPMERHPRHVPNNTVKETLRLHKLQQISRLLQNNRYRTALRETNNLLSLGIDDHEVHLAASIIHLQLNNLNRAHNHALRSYHLNPDERAVEIIQTVTALLESD